MQCIWILLTFWTIYLILDQIKRGNYKNLSDAGGSGRMMLEVVNRHFYSGEPTSKNCFSFPGSWEEMRLLTCHFLVLDLALWPFVVLDFSPWAKPSLGLLWLFLRIWVLFCSSWLHTIGFDWWSLVALD